MSKVHLTDEEKRVVAFIEWQATVTSNLDAQIALEIVAESIREGKHNGWEL
jgi:hypothetical protein